MAEENGWLRRVRALARRGDLPHAVILSGAGSDASQAQYLCAAMLCTEQDKPCLHCAACRKVLGGIHPDVYVADDPDHKELSMDLMRSVRQDAYIRPNEGARKIFVFPDSARLNERDQNVLLKIVEEGPPYAAFIFCAVSAALLLPTVRSRCVEINLRLPEGAFVPPEDAAALCRALLEEDAVVLSERLAALENRRLKREELQSILRGAWRVCADALLLRCGKPDPAQTPDSLCYQISRRFDGARLNRLIALLRRCGDECDYNVGTGHVLGALLAGWDELCRKG